MTDGHELQVGDPVVIRGRVYAVNGDAITVSLDTDGAEGLTAVYLPLVRSLVTLDPRIDPTTIPQPRRWGRVIRGQHIGERVYWDASLYARDENAWTNIDRTRRFSDDQVTADRRISRDG